MPQQSLIVDALKRYLKNRGLTYADVAPVLDLSEASVKRLFSEASFTLERLDRVCELIGIEISDLARTVEDRARSIKELAEEQEEELVKNPKLFLVFYLLLNDYHIDEIVADYRVEPLEGVRLLARLDRMGLIELQPGNKAKLLVSRQLQWRKTGPIRRFFEQKVRSEFLHARFDRYGEGLKFVSGLLSRASQIVMQRKLDLLAQEFAELVRADTVLPLEERHGTSLLLAQRRWEFSLFAELRRDPLSA
jgi:transcriptional regulator with XRE-family HTH domain